jgi:hypothetical protein
MHNPNRVPICMFSRNRASLVPTNFKGRNLVANRGLWVV